MRRVLSAFHGRSLPSAPSSAKKSKEFSDARATVRRLEGVAKPRFKLIGSQPELDLRKRFDGNVRSKILLGPVCEGVSILQVYELIRTTK